MELFDLHVHSTFSDGENEPGEIVLAAIAKGVKTLGFSDHSYTGFDESQAGFPRIYPVSRGFSLRSAVRMQG